MKKENFINILVSDFWQWAQHKEQGMDGIAFRKKINNKWIKYHLSTEGIKRITKEQLIQRLKSHDVTHMTRIVGYYSRVNNWNASKLGELADRQKGDYYLKEQS